MSASRAKRNAANLRYDRSEKGKTRHRIYNASAAGKAVKRAWRERQKKLGLCTSCTEKAIPGTTKCPTHTAIVREHHFMNPK